MDSTTKIFRRNGALALAAMAVGLYASVAKSDLRGPTAVTDDPESFVGFITDTAPGRAKVAGGLANWEVTVYQYNANGPASARANDVLVIASHATAPQATEASNRGTLTGFLGDVIPGGRRRSAIDLVKHPNGDHFNRLQLQYFPVGPGNSSRLQINISQEPTVVDEVRQLPEYEQPAGPFTDVSRWTVSAVEAPERAPSNALGRIAIAVLLIVAWFGLAGLDRNRPARG
jgi:hypothetical protein